MGIVYTRLINETGSQPIHIDKINFGTNNGSGYSGRAVQPSLLHVYNQCDPVCSTRKGYIDLVKTDEVKLLMRDNELIGSFKKLGLISYSDVNKSDIVKSVVSNVVISLNDVTITGSTFLSVNPDFTYVKIEDPVSGSVQFIGQTDFSSNSSSSVVFLKSKITIGNITNGWYVTMFSNSKYSDKYIIH